MGADETGSVEALGAADAKPGTGTLKFGLQVGATVHTEFELRQVTSGDYFDAEAETGGALGIKLRAALVARQLVRIGSYEGPFTLEMMARMPPPDLNRLINAREELELSGEGWQRG